MKKDQGKINPVPHPLLDAVMVELKVSTDKSLARLLGLGPSAVSKIRRKRCRITPLVLLNLHILTEWPVDRLRMLCGEQGP